MPRQSFLADTIRLEYVENTGAFLGLGADWPPAVRTALFGIGNGLLLLQWASWPSGIAGPRWRCSAWRSSSQAVRPTSWIGMTRGGVIDFMNVGLGPLRTGIFNVADMAIMLGAGLVILADRYADGDARTANST